MVVFPAQRAGIQQASPEPLAVRVEEGAQSRFPNLGAGVLLEASSRGARAGRCRGRYQAASTGFRDALVRCPGMRMGV